MFFAAFAKFSTRTIVLSLLVTALSLMLYANYVYADKYAWNESGLSDTFSVTAVSGDGQIMFGVIDNKMYYSTTNGVSWLPGAGTFTAFAANEIVTDIAVSDDGMRVLVSTNRGLYLSSDYGSNFSSGGSLNDTNVLTVSMSSSGSDVFISNTDGGFYSTDGGQGLYSSILNGSTFAYASDMTGDGQRVYIADNEYCLSYSENSGQIFTQNCSAASGISKVYTDDTGQHVLAIESSGLRLRVSNDYGDSFVTVGPVQSTFPWVSASVSGNGSKMVALTLDGAIYTSNDYGITWRQEVIPGAYRTGVDISLSYDGYIVSSASSDSYGWIGTYDLIAPNITNITSTLANGTYTVGQEIPITVTFNEWIYSSNETLNLTFETGATDRTCTLSIATASSTGTCIYTVQSGDTSSDLSVSGASGSLSDENNTRTSSFANLASFATNKNIEIDAVAPSVTLTEPTIGTYASGTISLTATASDVNLVGVQFKYNNTNIGSEDISSPYTISWDTTGVSDGSYTINAVARDTAGNTATSSVSIIVNNVAPNAPTITSPVDGFASEDLEYTIGGSCESGAEVSVSNSNLVTSPITVTCASNLYSADIEFNSGTIGIESVSVTQTDEGGKISASTTSTIEIQSVTPPSSPATSTPSSSQSSFGSLTSKSGGSSPSPSLFQGGIPLNQITQLNNNNNNNNNIAISESQISASKKLFDAELPQQFRFTKDLSIGVTDEDVKNLQKILNITGFEVSNEGAGSIGNETSVFGEKTMTALRRFQKAFGIIPMSGYFGYITRYILNDILDVIGY